MSGELKFKFNEIMFCFVVSFVYALVYKVTTQFEDIIFECDMIKTKIAVLLTVKQI